MPDNAIQVVELSKRFGRHPVLDGVTFDIPKGQTVGLVGNNGSGKSVLLKCMCGLLIPSSGTVQINGKQLGKDIGTAPELGAVIEAPGFLPQRSGYANLKALWGLNKRVPLTAVPEAMRRVGLDPHNKKRVGKYSMGMKQRLGIAQALMENPSILLLDEPFNGLDKNGLRDMYALLRELRDSGITALIASHNPLDIAELCSTVYEIDAGRLAQVR
ncbi:ABC transporter ATP-binding protein [Bacillota bacterium Meth-B3]